MGSPAELTLNCSPCSTASSSALTNDSLWEGQLEERKKLEKHLQALEDERRKIEAFKRELPICMQLLTEAIEASKELIQECQTSAPFGGKVWTSCNYGDSSYKSTSEKPVLEEFIPLKIKENNAVDGQGTLMNVALKHDSDEKLKWMDILKQGSLQPEGEDHREQQKASAADKENSSSSNLFLHSKDRIGGAFLPFSRDKQAVFQSSTPLAPSLPELTLNSRSHEAHTLPRHEESGTPCNLARGRLKDKAEQQKEINLKTNTAGLTGGTNNSSHAVNQSQRKARRCWSPELHRRFVDALQKLGGSQVATPKQIREHMKVDGLTNDEVKSHLQKYRLHIRRPSPIPETADPHTQPLVVFGGIWVPPEYATMVAQQGPNLYNSKQPNLIPSSTTQDFYSQLNTSSKMQFESSMFYDRQQIVAAHSQCSLHELTHFSGHLCNGTYASHEAGNKKSIEEDRKSETSKCKRDEQEEGLCGAEDSHTDS